jgi:hypothetical protein
MHIPSVLFPKLLKIIMTDVTPCSLYGDRSRIPTRAGHSKPLEDVPDKLVTLFFGTRNTTPDVPFKNALICTKVCSFASSMLITMPRIMTDPANQFQTHFMLEKATY